RQRRNAGSAFLSQSGLAEQVVTLEQSIASWRRLLVLADDLVAYASDPAAQSLILSWIEAEIAARPGAHTLAPYPRGVDPLAPVSPRLARTIKAVTKDCLRAAPRYYRPLYA